MQKVSLCFSTREVEARSDLYTLLPELSVSQQPWYLTVRSSCGNLVGKVLQVVIILMDLPH